MTGSRLTWHTGSILPFASLWHTLMRVAALNSLRVHELPDTDVHRDPGARSTKYYRASLLYNESSNRQGEGISTRALARWLHEPAKAFEWSHLGRIPKSLRGLVHDGFRICPQCSKLGYHSALMSLRLLETCPIHGCALLSRCHCGRPFDNRLGVSTLSRAGYCACGQLAFVSRDTLRRPIATPTDTQPFDAVAEWLTSFVTLSRPRIAAPSADALLSTQWLEHVRQWSDALDLTFPSCFIMTPPATGLRSVSTCGPQVTPPPSFTHIGPRAFRAGEQRQDGRYWDVNPATLAYRSMLRYLRRHVTRGAESFSADFLSQPDPVRIANLMRSNHMATVAYAELLWSTHLEQHIRRRRWPYRPVEQGQGGDHVGRFEPPSPAFDTLPFIFQDRAWLTWVQYQAARTALLSCWRQAQHLALRAVRTGIADVSMTDGADAWRWSTVRCGSVARFIALESQPSLAWALPLHDKAHRRRAHIAASARRQCAMEDACAGMCLTWCEVAGWTVEASYIPNGSPVDRHRLLGVGQARPHFWLFGSEGQYVARACETKLQVRAETARAAIEGLRQAVAQYRRSYPAERSLPTFAG
jgi:hypothetical protein